MAATDREKIRSPGQASDRRNPRRVAANASVSLKKAPKAAPLSHASDQPSVGDVSAASMAVANSEVPTPPSNKRANETFNADKWFDESNRNAVGKTNVKFIDDDPPFYLKKQRSSDDDGEESSRHYSSKSATLRNRLVHGINPSGLQTLSSTSDDFRSVIDDLTIENQELKRKLRQYEGMNCDHLQDEKLFEVRVFGLSQSRRRKLEGVLRDFVQTVGTSPPDSLESNVPPYLAIAGAQNTAGAATKRSDSSASNRPIDSAYASMSVTNTASGSQNQHGAAEPRRPLKSASAAPPKDHAVQSYLQNISRGLLPKYPPFMTEKAKKRLVVRRLEQLFIGRGSSADKHSQFAQQQEVSQSAANADRKETEAMGHRVEAEGRREAKMTKLAQLNAITAHAEVRDQISENYGNGVGNGSTAVTPDQRPTRPLDLDPSRAQNPAETISYMKHLGFSSPRMDPARIVGDEDSWIPLNLLVNMAQLHTLNVTPDFVRAALSDLSSTFEMSEDGQNVRWKGGYRGSKLSSDGSQNSDGSNGSPPEDGDYRRDAQPKSHRTVPELLVDGGRNRMTGKGGLKGLRHWPNPHQRAEHKYYSPLFYYPDENNSGSPNQDISSTSMNQTEDKSNEISHESSAAENKSSSHTTRETGSLIFYRKAKFCTDLRGDSTFPTSNLVYERRTYPAIGIDTPMVEEIPPEAKGAISSPQKAGIDAEAGVGHESKDDAVQVDEIEFFPSEDLVEATSPPLKNLPSSGIGGVVPADNFCIEATRKYGGTGQSELVGEQLRELDPSPLPPPSYAFMHFSSSSSDVEDSDLADSGSGEDAYPRFVGEFTSELNGRHFIPPNLLVAGALGAATGGYSSQSADANGSGANQSTETSEGSSFDMLEFARKADPETVAAQEREFDATLAMPETAPPGSVAATIGDRSTFITSQDDTASMDDGQLRMMQERKAGLKRERSEQGSHRGVKVQRMELDARDDDY